MAAHDSFRDLSPTALAEVLAREQVMDIGIRPLWSPMPRIAGPAFPVRCPPGDNLMLHAAIYRALPGSVVVVQAGDVEYAMAGGNVCAVAQRRGVVAFVIDGVIRDLAEVRARGFPVFARGVIPSPGKKEHLGVLDGPVRCGGVSVGPRDVVVADEEGVVVVPALGAQSVLEAARTRAAADAAQSLDDWEAAHRAKVEKALKGLGLG